MTRNTARTLIAATVAALLIVAILLTGPDPDEQRAMRQPAVDGSPDGPDVESPGSEVESPGVAPGVSDDADGLQPAPKPDIVWRERPALSLPDEVLLDVDALRALAENGNAEAAAQLGNLFSSCMFVGPPASEAGLQLELQDLRRSIEVPIYKRNGDRGLSSYAGRLDQFDKALETYACKVRACGAIPFDERRNFKNWYSLAAMLGYEDANVLHHVLDSADDSYRKSMERRWRQGDHDALIYLAFYHDVQFYDGDSDDGDVKGFAYSIARMRLRRQFYEDRDLPVPQDTVAFFENFDRYFADSLTPYKKRQAERLADEIVASNSKCCVAPDIVGSQSSAVVLGCGPD